MRHAEAWIEALGSKADEVVAGPHAIEDANRRGAAVEDGYVDPRTPALAGPRVVADDLAEREAWIAGRIDAGNYVEGQPGTMARARKVLTNARDTDVFRVAVGELAVWCLPTEEGIYTPARDLAFDRNRCSTLRAGEPLRVLKHDPLEQWYYVHGGHSVGWVHAPKWTPPLARETLDHYMDATPQAMVLRDDVVARPSSGAAPITLRLGVRVPLEPSSDDEAADPTQRLVQIPTTEGLTVASVPADAVHEGPLPLTRRRVLELAFAQLDDPYGWGGYGGGRDCSRFLHDLLVPFGLELGRNSAVIAQQGSQTIELAGLDEAAKLAAIDAAHQRGLVLLYMPGHIMLYLGRARGVPLALSSLSEFLEPCPHENQPDEVYRLDRVEVTTLELGRGTARTSFIERLERAVLISEQHD